MYAVEASDAADDAATLVQANGMGAVITVVRGKVEERQDRGVQGRDLLRGGVALAVASAFGRLRAAAAAMRALETYAEWLCSMALGSA